MTGGLFQVDKGSHFFRVYGINPTVLNRILDFTRKYIEYQPKQEHGIITNTAIAVYAVANKSRTEFRFHIGQYNDFVEYLAARGVAQYTYKVRILPIVEPEKLNLKARDTWIPYDAQVPVLEKFCGEEQIRKAKSLIPQRFLDARQTGTGKTNVALKCIERINYRTSVTVLARYVNKWKGDLKGFFPDLTDEMIYEIQGAPSIVKAIKLRDKGQFNYPFILITIETFRSYIDNYLHYGLSHTSQSGQVVTPENLLQFLGIGSRIIDEVHQAFHATFKIDCFTNIPYALSMSATLESLSQFMEKMYRISYPDEVRYLQVKNNQYITMIPVRYDVGTMSAFRRSLKRIEYGMYNHLLFEKEILKNKIVTEKYLELICEVVEYSFLKEYRRGDKLIIYCSLVEMCTLVTKYLSMSYRNLTCKRFVTGDPYENMIDPDIRVTTIGKAGAAMDIPGLVTVLQTVNISSVQAVKQVAGRLRYIEGRTLRWVYLTCDAVKKHRNSDTERQKMMADFVKSIKPIRAVTRI